MSPEQRPFDDNQTPTLEMAYVLFMDIVGYSRMPTDVQQETLRRLQRSVRCGFEFKKAQEQQRLISLPTGDGMALVFFTDPESCVRCAVEITKALKDEQGIPLRIGMHAGPVFRVADINANENVAGEGINIAQRVMDCGDAGHILVSRPLANVLQQLSGWVGALQDLGETQVKHGVKVHVFNLLVQGVGNPVRPKKFAKGESEVGWRKKRIAVVVAVCVLAVAGSIAALVKYRSSSQLPRRPHVAVLDFKNLVAANGTDWVSTTLSEGLRIELGAGNRLIPTPGREIADMMRDLSMSSESSYDLTALQTMRTHLGCDYVVSGAYSDPGTEAGGNLTVNLKMVDAETGMQVAGFVYSGTERGVAQLVMRLGGRLRTAIQLSGASPTEIDQIRAAIPSNSEAQPFYYEGVRRQRAFDLLGARESYTKAIQADKYFPLAHAGLAEVWKGLGYDGKAAEEAKMAFDLSSQLGKDEKKLVEALYLTTTYDWEGAAKIYGALWTVNRDVPEYALLAADAQIHGKKENDSLETLAELRATPGVFANSPVIDLREAEAYESLGDSKNEAATATKASDKAHTMGRRLLEAEALWRLCAAKASLGEQAPADSACNTSMEIAKAIGDHLLVARDQTVLGLILESQGGFSGAMDKYQQALGIAKSLGAQRDVIGAKVNIANVRGSMGDHRGALNGYNEALSVARETRDQLHITELTNNLGVESQAAGEYATALIFYRESLEAAQQARDRGSEARALGNMAGVDTLQGRLMAAVDGGQRAVKLARNLGLNRDANSYLYQLGDTQLAQGDFALAEKNYQEGAASSKAQGDKTNEALGWLSLSWLRLQSAPTKAPYSEAKILAQQAAAEFHAEGLKSQESSALAAVALAEMELGESADAGNTIRQAISLAPMDPSVKLPVDIVEARIQLRAGAGDKGRAELLKVISTARRLGLEGIRMEAELAIAESANRSTGDQSQLSLLRALDKESGRKGFKGIQERSESILRKLGAA